MYLAHQELESIDCCYNHNHHNYHHHHYFYFYFYYDVIIMHKALRSCHATMGKPYQDVGHHFCHGFRQRLLLLADAPALLHARHEEVLQLIGVMHGLAGAHCDGLLQCALHARYLGLCQWLVKCSLVTRAFL